MNVRAADSLEVALYLKGEAGHVGIQVGRDAYD